MHKSKRDFQRQAVMQSLKMLLKSIAESLLAAVNQLHTCNYVRNGVVLPIPAQNPCPCRLNKHAPILFQLDI